MKVFFFLAFVVATVAAACTNDCTECGEDEIACYGMDPEACPTCIPTLDGSLDNWGNPCWNTCPMTCHEGDQVCGAGVDPWNGCNNPGWCEPAMDPVTECPFHCPIACAETEMQCFGGMDANGCMMPDMCVPSKDGSTDKWGNPCWNSCPTLCQEGEQVCGAGVDPWTGCNNPGWCAPTMAGDCPHHCPMNCGPEEISCWGGVDANGCMMPDYCVPMTQQCGM